MDFRQNTSVWQHNTDKTEHRPGITMTSGWKDAKISRGIRHDVLLCVCMSMKVTFYLMRCSVILSAPQKRHRATTGSRLLGSVWPSFLFSRCKRNWEDSGACNKDVFPTWLAISKKCLNRSTGCIALRNIGVCFCFQKGTLVPWCFNTPQKKRKKRKKEGGKDESKKKSKTLFHKQTEGLARFCTSTTAAFSGVAKQRLKLGDMF